MKVKIEKQITGLKKDIYYDIEKEEIITNHKDYINFNILNKLYFKNKYDNLLITYRNIIETLNMEDIDIMWPYLIGVDKLKKRNNSIINDIKNLDQEDISYIKTLKQRIQFTSNITNSYFKCGKKLDIPIYDHCSTITGRAVIKSGYNFLTSKKSDRLNICSKYDMGEICEIDIKSLEPRILMHLNGHQYVEDIYDHFKNILNINAERKKIKLAVISIMYGSSVRNAESLTGVSSSDLKKIYKYLKIEEWTHKLKEEMSLKGYITNPYGKKIYKDGPLVNYYFQSTGADCSFLSFKNLVEKYKDQEFSLLASIHDAIIVDTGWNVKANGTTSVFENLNNEKHIYCSTLDIKLPVKVKRIKNEKEND